MTKYHRGYIASIIGTEHFHYIPNGDNQTLVLFSMNGTRQRIVAQFYGSDANADALFFIDAKEREYD